MRPTRAEMLREELLVKKWLSQKRTRKEMVRMYFDIFGKGDRTLDRVIARAKKLKT